jgi:hypothetical protein
MVSFSQCEKVFKGEGFLSNDPGHGSPYRHVCHISKENPTRLLGRLHDYGYYCDKCKLDSLLNAGVQLLEDKDVVLNEFTGKIVPSAEELYSWIKNSCEWRYVEYAK